MNGLVPLYQEYACISCGILKPSFVLKHDAAQWHSWLIIVHIKIELVPPYHITHITFMLLLPYATEMKSVWEHELVWLSYI